MSQAHEARPFPLEPTPIQVPEDVLADLRRRLEATRWPDDAGNEDGYYGVNGAYLRELVDYWRDGYDWRKAEAAINAYEHYHVAVDGVPVHFMRRPGTGLHPTPLILTHGWPWTFWHWSKVVDPLADPGAHGADPAEAFDVIIPSFPGFGFSAPLPRHPELNFWKVADLWHTLMTRVLGHDRHPVIEAPTGITFVGYENPPGVDTAQRVRHFLSGDRAAWYNHVNLTAHDQGGHFIPWEIPDRWVDDLRRTFRLARPAA